MLLARDCPICNSKERDVLCAINLFPVSDELLPPSFKVVVCSRCGFCFDDIVASQKDFDLYYQKNIKYQNPGTLGGGGVSCVDMMRYARVFDLCKRYISNTSTILDIGAGQGGLLQYIRKNANCKNLYAVEPSALFDEQNDIRFYTSIDFIIRKGIKFEFIFCTQVMEHIYDLKNFIQKIYAVSSDNAFIYIEVPNAGKYIEGYKAPFYYFDREHINHFTLNSLKNLFTINGFQIIDHDDSNNLSIIARRSAEKINECVECKYADPDAIVNYVQQSMDIDTLQHYDDIHVPIILWGFGAYLRKIFLKPDFPRNISAIIDRDRGGKGDSWNGIPFVSEAILDESEFSKATVIITSVLYADEIKRQLQARGFAGKVLTAF